MYNGFKLYFIIHIFMKFRWIRLVYIIPFVLGICCAVAYWSIPSYVAEDGTLIEAFGFVPIGMFLFVIGGIGLVVTELILYTRKNQRGNK